MSEELNFSRRQFFRLMPWHHVEIATQEEKEPVKYIRPPGAVEEKEFLQRCKTDCFKCSDACPHNVIMHLDVCQGQHEDTPYLLPDENPCYWCPEMFCIQACPTGALKNSEKIAPIAKVTMNEDNCMAKQGAICDNCATACPSTLRAITMRGRTPQLKEDLCVGCGLCVDYCPTEPRALTIEIIQ